MAFPRLVSEYDMPFTPVGDALQDKMKQNTGLKKQIETNAVVEISEKVFADYFGEQQSVHVKPLFLKNRTLTVTCSNSAVAQEIRLNQSHIVARINDALGEPGVDRIRYLA